MVEENSEYNIYMTTTITAAYINIGAIKDIGGIVTHEEEERTWYQPARMPAAASTILTSSLNASIPSSNQWQYSTDRKSVV